jgi:WD40 repeat protein
MVHEATYGGSDRLIATASADQSARLWSAANGELLAAPFRHSGPVFFSRLTRDGLRLLTAGEDGKVQRWDLAVSDWPLADLRRYSEVLSCQSLQPDGRLQTLGAQEVAARMDALRAARPRDFEVWPDELERWHRREKIDSQRAGNPFAAGFHASRTSLPDFD